MNTFGHKVIQTAVENGMSWERVIKAFPDLDYPEYAKHYNFCNHRNLTKSRSAILQKEAICTQTVA